MSDGPMKAEFVDRIDRLTELAEAEREVQAASTKFEQAQWEVVKAAEHLQEWTNVWKYRRESVLRRYPDTLTPEQITFYGQGNRLSEANEVLRQFCASVEAKNKQLSALTPPLQHKGGETEAGGLLDPERQVPDESNSQASSTDATDISASSKLVASLDGDMSVARDLARMVGADVIHSSDCALHNGPAFEPGPCDCGAHPGLTPEEYEQSQSASGMTLVAEFEQEITDLQTVDGRLIATLADGTTADEPVTKPEADVFSHGIQAQKKEEPRKFGSIFGDITKFGRS